MNNDSNIPNISVRISDPELYKRLTEVKDEHGMSYNLTIQMLLGYAFNEIDRSEKKFKPKVVFVSE